jgi:hypothetical protein
MTTIFGLAKLSPTDFQYVRTVGQEILYSATTQYLQMANEDRVSAANLFVQGRTDKYAQKYKLPMTGRMQKRSGQVKSAAIRRTGEWSVAYPLYEFGDELAITDHDFAYMSPQEFQDHIDGIIIRSVNTYRFEILRRIFKNTTDTFSDPYNGQSLTIQPLANGTAGELYPPVIGSETEATANHYLESGYAASAIADGANNPYTTITDLLTSRFGRQTGGIPIATLINKAQRQKTEALTGFTKYVANGIIPGADTDQVRAVNIPGEIIGYTDSTWVSIWDWIPENYLVSIYLDAPKPLMERVHPADTGLAPGLQLKNNQRDYPLNFNDWEYDFGIGTGNRLNGAVMELGTGGTYSIPSDYA